MEDVGDILEKELDNFLGSAELTIQNINAVKAIIGPHAGFDYSGPTAGWAYRYLQMQLEKEPPKTIFLLGPSHKKYFKGCSLSGMSELETPLGNLKVDIDSKSALME